MSQERTVALVSGATGIIGKAIATELAATPGWEVVLLARDTDRAEATAADIRSVSGKDAVRFILADVARRSAIEAVADAWQGPLHVLVNNAGIAPRQRETTPEGIELTLATNVLAYLWVTDAFARHLAASAPARVVNVASDYAGDLDSDDLEFTRRRFDNRVAYRQSKQANRMLTVVQAEELAATGITVHACHPGNPSSVLSRNLGFGGAQSPDESARTPVMLARGDLGAGSSGRYFARGAEAACAFGRDRDRARQLYDICRRYA